jgi:hypothetical protein
MEIFYLLRMLLHIAVLLVAYNISCSLTWTCRLLLTRSVSISMLLAAHIALQSSVFCTMFTTMYLMVCIFVLILPNPCFVYICRGKIIKISAFVLLLNSTGPKNQYLRRNWPSPKMAQTGYTFAPNSPKVQSMPGTAQQILAP